MDAKPGIVCELKYRNTSYCCFDWPDWFATRLQGRDVAAPRLATPETTRVLSKDQLLDLRSRAKACSEGRLDPNAFSLRLLKLSFRYVFAKSDLKVLWHSLTAPPKDAEIVQQLSLFYKHVSRDPDLQETVRDLAVQLKTHVTEALEDRDARRNLAAVLQE